MLPRPATEFYALQQRVNATARREIARQWRKMGDDFESSWRLIAPVVLAELTAAQESVARRSAPYLAALVAATGLPDDPAGRLNPYSLVGVASDGRPLETLAYGAVVKAGEAFNDGATKTVALKTGGAWLDLMTQLQVADAARIATSIGAQVQPDWKGYVRYLNPPSCQRCAVLAGRVYRRSTGFDRHPGCDCIMVPCKDAAWAEAEGFVGNPDDAWRQGHIKDLTKGQQRALEDGADISQIVNAKRGMSTTTDIKGARFDFTQEGITRRGVYGRSDFAAAGGYNVRRTGRRQGYIKNQAVRTTRRSRLTPETIYRVADDRAHAVQLLERYGYILPY